MLTRTSASYGGDHVERVRLIRALTTVGGLSLATTKAVLQAISVRGVSRSELMGAAQRALLGEGYVTNVPPGGQMVGSSRARLWLARVGWQVHPEDPVIDALDAARAACDDAGPGPDEERMSAYAEAVLAIARTDVASVPQDPGEAVRQVVLGTVLVDAVLSSLRRLAQQHIAVSEGG
ncbi:transcriptional regulator [Janibacter limosus]|uniref:Transcriptional regulator n=1 Tax=Janibacter limosus TaxID=53458 RepID=A0AC61U4G4_9MICO|nr:transcriptional regulator [Janibacter limosus]UUZ44891.1 transcriptional regulator [Janibacter limosus]